MARPRKPGSTGLPPNLYLNIRNGIGIFRYNSKITGKSTSLGADREKAIAYALEANLEVEGRRGMHTHAKHSIKHGYIDYRGLLEEDTIAQKALIYEHVCGVYFLLDGEKIVYVGQSTNVLTRLAEHRRDTRKVFSRVFMVECGPGELLHLESLYIDKFKPIYNSAIPFVRPESTAWDASISSLFRDAVFVKDNDKF